MVVILRLHSDNEGGSTRGAAFVTVGEWKQPNQTNTYSPTPSSANKRIRYIASHHPSLRRGETFYREHEINNMARQHNSFATEPCLCLLASRLGSKYVSIKSYATIEMHTAIPEPKLWHSMAAPYPRVSNTLQSSTTPPLPPFPPRFMLVTV